MAEEQRKLLEQLMGRDAMISPQLRRREAEMTSHRVCKAFLVGTCPHDLFIGTKQDLGKCPLLHLEKHRLEYEYRTKKLGEKFPEFEYEYYKILDQFIYHLNKTISIAHNRLKHTPEEKAKIAAVTKDLETLDIKIGLMNQEITCLLENNKSLQALKQSITLNDLCKQRTILADQARNIVENIGQTSQQKLQVCEGCGAYLSRLDSDRRLADHLVGKIHLGFVQMRKDYDELHYKFARRNDRNTHNTGNQALNREPQFATT